MKRFFIAAVVALIFSGNYCLNAQTIYFGKIVSTLAGNGLVSSSVLYPQGVAIDGSGNMYISCGDNYVRKVTTAGVVSIFAGNGIGGSDDGPSLGGASFNNPIGIAVDASGTNVYVADYSGNSGGGQVIRKINGGNVTTIAGSIGGLGHADNTTGKNATFSYPMGLALNPAGTVLYVADNLNNTIRAVGLSGVYPVTTYAGTYVSSNNGATNSATNSSATFSSPAGIATDASGNLYVADKTNSLIRKIAVGGGVTTLAGNIGAAAGFADGLGTAAIFGYPYAVAVDPSGNVYVTDGNELIRMITPAGQVTTLAGVYNSSNYAEGIGSVAQFYNPKGIGFYNSNVFVADNFDSRLREISSITSLTGFSTTYSTPSAAQGIDVGGYSLTGNISVTAPTGYEVSLTSGSGYGSSVSIAPVSGSVAWNTVVYVRIAATAAVGTVSGNLTLSGGGATSQSVSLSGTVLIANQTITFGSLSPVTYGIAPFTLTATATSGLTVDFTSSDPTVASLSGVGGSTVTINKVGMVTIYANESGSSNYNAAPQVSQTLTVDPIPQTITFSPPASHAYGVIGGSTFYLSYSVSSGLNNLTSYASSNSSVATIDATGLVTVVGAGSTNITIYQAGDALHAAATSVTQTLTITKGSQTTYQGSFSTPDPAIYPGVPFTLSGSASSGLPAVFSSTNTSVATVNASTGVVTVVGAGSTYFNIDQPGNANYNAAPTSISAAFQVNPGPSNLAIGTINTVTYGVAPFNIASLVTSSSPGAITYTSSNSNVATIDGTSGLVDIVGAGIGYFTINQAATTNYLSASIIGNFQVNPATQNIIFSVSPSAVTYGASPITLNGVSNSGLPVTYSSSDASVAFVSGNTLTFGDPGTATIYVNQAGNSKYLAASTVTQNITVDKANQILTFTAMGPVTYGYGQFPSTMTSYGSSNDPSASVSFSSSNTSVITISGGYANVVGAGSAIITALSPSDADYNAATNATQTITVYKAGQTINFGALGASTFGDPALTMNATATSGLAVSYSSSNTGVATVSGNMVTIVGAGTTIITSAQSGNTNYTAASSVPQTLTVAQLGQSITFGSLPPVFVGNAPFTLSGSASSGLAVSYTSSNPSVATVSGSTVTILSAGTTTITASQAGNTNYSAASNVPQTLTASQVSQTITFGSLSQVTVGTSPYTLSATASSGLTVSYSSSNTSVATVNGSTITIVGAGATSITATQAGNNEYSPATAVIQSLTVNEINQTITFGSLSSATFGDSPITLSGSASSGLTVSYSSSNTSVATVSGSVVTIIGAGSTTITASQPGNASYNAASNVGQSLTVSRAGQTITFGSLSAITYGATPIVLSATTTSGLTISYSSSNTSVATISSNILSIVGAGATTITASQSGTTNYTAAISIPHSLTVNQASQTITFNTLPILSFGQSPVDLNIYASSNSGLTLTYISSDVTVATISGSILTIIGKGTATISAAQSGNTNYTAATGVIQPITVERSQTITFDAIPTKLVTDAPFNLSASASSGLSVTYSSSNTQVATVSGSLVTIVGAGTTTIAAAQSGNTDYGAASNVTQTLVVSLVQQTITFDVLPSKSVTDTPFNLSASASSGLTVAYSSSNTQVATVSGSLVTIVGAGTANIIATQSGNSTYSAATDVTQIFTVTLIPQAIAFGSLPAKLVTDVPFNLTATASSGLTVAYSSSNSQVATVNGSVITIVGAGTTDITAAQPGNMEYGTASNVTQTLAVSLVPQTITFDVLSAKSVTDGPFNLNASASSGLSVTYSSSNSQVATVDGSLVTIIGAGTTDITAAQPGDTEYSAASNVVQTLLVKSLVPQTITFDILSMKWVTDAPFNLSASSSSGLSVTYSSSNTQVATVDGNLVTVVGAGTTNITAAQPGDRDYGPASNVIQTLVVSLDPQTITFNALPAKEITDTAFNLSAMASSGLTVTYSSSNLQVATISGNTVTIVGTGSANIIASQAGDATYAVATPVTQSLTVDSKIISLSGTTVASDTLDFGNQVVLGLNSMQKFTITNSGTASLTISSITYPSGFTGDQSNSTLAAGSSLDVNVTFTPTSLGKSTGAILFTSDATSGPSQIIARGTAVKITGVEKTATPFLVYPNPGNGIFYIEGIDEPNENQSVEIIDASGRSIGSFTLSNYTTGKYQLDISSQNTGLYLIRLSDTTVRVIKN